MHGFLAGKQPAVEDASVHQPSELEMDNGMDPWNIVMCCMLSWCFGASYEGNCAENEMALVRIRCPTLPDPPPPFAGG